MAQPVDIEWIDGPQMAMANPTIVDVLMEVCDLEDLARFRLVCKSWYQASLTRFREYKVLQISENVRRGKYRVDGTLGVREALQIVELPEIARKPFRKFQIDLRVDANSEWENGLISYLPLIEDYERLFTVLGPTIYSLYINYFVHPPGWDLARWILQNCGSLQKLQVIQFDNGDDWFKVNHVREAPFHTCLTSLDVSVVSEAQWEEILRIFPKLQQIIIDPCHYHLIAIQDAFLAMNPADRATRRLEIAFNHALMADINSPGLLDELLDFPGVSVKRLMLTREKDSGTAFEDMIRICHEKSSSKPVCLDLRNYCTKSAEPSIEVERLLGAWRPLLSEIILDCSLIRNLHFLIDSPNLKVLSLSCLTRSVLEASQPGNMPILEQLKSVEVRFPEFDHLCDQDIRLFSKLGPNMTTFKAPLNNCSFRALCFLMPGIRRLTVNDFSETVPLDDFGLTGILDTTGVDDPRKTFRLPSIMNLKHLVYFEGYGLNLSDKSVYDGFLEMHFLVKLRITMSSKTSDAAFYALWSRFPSGLVTRSEVEGFTSYATRNLNKRLSVTSKQLRSVCWI